MECLPNSDKGAILFTTRSRKAAEKLTPSNVLEVGDMSKAEARQQLARRISKQELLRDETAVEDLLEMLAYLPLAITQVAAFISNNDISVPEYVSLFQNTDAELELFSEHFEDPGRYKGMDSTIAKTWHISFDQIRKTDRLAADYLSFMACIDRTNIPQSLLPPGGSLVEQVKALGTLTGYAFITERQKSAQEQATERFFDMHRLVHMTSGWWLDKHNERAFWTEKTMSRLIELVPYGGIKAKNTWTPYLRHALHVSLPSGTADAGRSACLIERVGVCQQSLGQYKLAEQTLRLVCSLRSRILGPEDFDTLGSMNYLARALNMQGKYIEAEALSRRVLAKVDTMFGPENIYSLQTMENLTNALRGLGKLEEAEAITRRCLAQSTKMFGLEHPETLIIKFNLANILSQRGNKKEGEVMRKEVLAEDIKLFDLDHPKMMRNMNDLAATLVLKGRGDEAAVLYRQSLARHERVFGPTHPETLAIKHQLAVTTFGQHKFEEGEKMMRENLAELEEVLGPEHPQTLRRIEFLATILQFDHQDESYALWKRAYAISRTIHGEDHAKTLSIQQRISELLADQARSIRRKQREDKMKSRLSRGLARLGIHFTSSEDVT
jgi:tetratricopeptide (TPR) repeat protein